MKLFREIFEAVQIKIDRKIEKYFFTVRHSY